MKQCSVQIWIDGDSCPTLVRNYVFQYAKKRTISAYFVSNKKILEDAYTKNEIVIENAQKDGVDKYILEKAKSGDLIITKDILFAEQAIKNKICTINDRGTIFTETNIAQKIADRNFDLSLAEIGFKSPRTKNYDKEKFGKFVATFEKEMKRLVSESYQL